MTEKPTFHDVFSKLLEGRLMAAHRGESLKTVSTQIYTSIFDTLVELLERVKAPIGNEAVNYIAQQYYDGILINDNQSLDPNIFNQRASLDNVPTKELAFMSVLLMGTDFRIPIIQMIKQRS